MKEVKKYDVIENHRTYAITIHRRTIPGMITKRIQLSTRHENKVYAGDNLEVPAHTCNYFLDDFRDPIPSRPRFGRLDLCL